MRDSTIGVDMEARIIRGMSVVTHDKVKGHDFWIDAAFLQQVVDASKGDAAGIKSRFKHPEDDSLGSHLGRAVNFRIEGNRVRADLKMSDLADKSPTLGKLGEYVLNLAAQEPGTFGASIHFDFDHAAINAFEVAHTKDGEFISPDPANTKHLPHTRLKTLWAVDVVGDAAANPTGLFGGVAKIAEGDTSSALGTRIQEAREKKNMTVEQLAADLPISASTLSQIENGQIVAPPADVLEAIADALDLSMEGLVGEVPKSARDRSREPEEDAMSTDRMPLQSPVHDQVPRLDMHEDDEDRKREEEEKLQGEPTISDLQAQIAALQEMLNALIVAAQAKDEAAPEAPPPVAAPELSAGIAKVFLSAMVHAGKVHPSQVPAFTLALSTATPVTAQSLMDGISAGQPNALFSESAAASQAAQAGKRSAAVQLEGEDAHKAEWKGMDRQKRGWFRSQESYLAVRKAEDDGFFTED